MNGNIILVDMDGVICDYDRELFKNNLISPQEHDKETWKDLQISDKRKEKIKKFVLKKGFNLKLKPIPGSIEGIEKLMSLGYEVYICSTPSSYHWCFGDKYRWIEKHIPFIREKVILTKNKSLIYGSFFIDDSLKQLNKWIHGTKILIQTNNAIKYPEISKEIIHVKSWKEIINFFIKL